MELRTSSSEPRISLVTYDGQFPASTLRDRIAARYERIETGDELADRDRELLLELSDRLDLLARTDSDHRHEGLLRRCVIMAENLVVEVLADSLEDRDAAEAIVSWTNRRYINEETNRHYRSALRVFAKRVTDGADPPDSIDRVPTATSSNHDPTPELQNVLKWDEHIESMIDEAFNAPMYSDS